MRSTCTKLDNEELYVCCKLSFKIFSPLSDQRCQIYLTFHKIDNSYWLNYKADGNYLPQITRKYWYLYYFIRITTSNVPFFRSMCTNIKHISHKITWSRWWRSVGNITAYHLHHFINHTDQTIRFFGKIYHRSLENVDIFITS